MAYQLTLPDIGEGVVEAEVQAWHVSPGDRVVEDQPLVEVMTDKATVTIPSPRRGTVTRLFYAVGDVARVHTPLVELELDAIDVVLAAPALANPAAPSPAAPGQRGPATAGAEVRPAKALATPAVRAMARSLGVDLQGVPGTGKGGRVTKEDVTAFREDSSGDAHHAHGGNGVHQGAHPPPPEPTAPAAGRGPLPSRLVDGSEERIPLRGLKKRIAEQMARSKRTAAHFTFVEQADVTELVRVKHRVADAAKKQGVKVTFLPFVVKSVLGALKKHPTLNASLDDERNELVLKRHYDLGIASATADGLTVPVLRRADQLSLLDIAREIERLSHDSKAGQTRPEDVGRGTFTITSLGALGGLFGTPVLNYPEVGILSVHRIRPTPVVRDGQIVIRDVLHVAVTGDHRVVDGQAISSFTLQVVKYLEDPSLLFMEMV
jgi:pyruvate dehydrogenase E2 component (dihydrolipoamide acetyltransferase)